MSYARVALFGQDDRNSGRAGFVIDSQNPHLLADLRPASSPVK